MNPSEPFPHFVDDVLAYFHEALPGRATLDGVHLHDDLLEDLSRNALEAHARALAGFSRRLSQINREVLSESEQVDHRILAAGLEGHIFDLERVRAWERSPMPYAQVLIASLAGLTYLGSASDTERARRLLSRLRQVPRLVAACRDNVREPAGLLVKVGLEAWRGLGTFIERDLPREFASLDDLHLLGDLADASHTAIDAIGACADHFEAIAPRARASFRLGADAIGHHIRVNEGLAVSADRLMEVSLAWLSQTQEAFQQTAAEVGRGDAVDVWRQVKQKSLEPDAASTGTDGLLDDLLAHLNKQTLVAMPELPAPRLAAAADFDRWQRVTLWADGPFEARPARARLTVGLPDGSWAEDRRRDQALDLSAPVRRTLLARESLPGRLLLATSVRQVESKIRRSTLFASRAFVDGWAHYSELALVEQGFRRNDPVTRLAQLSEALVALARLVVAIRLHADDMSVEQGVRFLRDEAYLEESTARREAERGVFDPGYLFQAVGSQLIQRLRRDFLEQRPEKSSPRAFHDALLSTGTAPLWAQRLLLVGDREPVTTD